MLDCLNDSKVGTLFYFGPDINAAYRLLEFLTNQYRKDGCGCQIEMVENES